MFKRSKPEPQPTEVMMYTLSTCPWCRRAKKFFNDHEVPFDYTDVDDLDGDERQQVTQTVMELCGAL